MTNAQACGVDLRPAKVSKYNWAAVYILALLRDP